MSSQPRTQPSTQPTSAPAQGAATDPVHETITSEPDRIEPLRLRCEAMAVALGFGEREVGEIGLCINEAIANVIEHAYEFATAKPIEVWFHPVDDAGKRGIEIKVRDWGPGIDPSKLPVKPKDPLVPGGLGLICMRAMMDSTDYAPPPKDPSGGPGAGIVLTLRKWLK